MRFAYLPCLAADGRRQALCASRDFETATPQNRRATHSYLCVTPNPYRLTFYGVITC